MSTAFSFREVFHFTVLFWKNCHNNKSTTSSCLLWKQGLTNLSLLYQNSLLVMSWCHEMLRAARSVILQVLSMLPNDKLKLGLSCSKEINFHNLFTLSTPSNALLILMFITAWKISVFGSFSGQMRSILSISPCSVWKRENTDQKNYEHGHFSRSVCHSYFLQCKFPCI